MILQILLVKHVVDKPRKPLPVILRLRIGERDMPVEIGVFRREPIVVVLIEHLAQGARAVPEGDFAPGFDALELVENMRAHGRHARAAADKHHLGIGVPGEKLAEGPVHFHLVTGLQIKHPGGHHPGGNARAARRRRGDANVELHHTLLFGVVGHGIGPNHRVPDLGHHVEKAEALPVAAILVIDIEIGILHHVRRTFELHVAPGAKIHVFTLGQAQGQFLDKRRHIGIALDRALPLLNAENFFGNLDLHVLLDRGLAGQAPALPGVARGKMRRFHGEHGPAALVHDAFALGTGAAAATGGGEENIRVGQGLQELAAGRHGDVLVAVDLNGDVAAADQHAARVENTSHQRQHDGREHSDTVNNSHIHGWSPWRSKDRCRPEP